MDKEARSGRAATLMTAQGRALAAHRRFINYFILFLSYHT